MRELIHCQGKSAPKYFIRCKGPLIIYDDLKNGWISLEKEEKIQEEFQLELNEILKANLDYKLEDQISAIKNIKKLHNGWEKVKFYNDYAGMVSKADYKAIHREGLKILTSKQMLQRLALAQVKTVNAS